MFARRLFTSGPVRHVFNREFSKVRINPPQGVQKQMVEHAFVRFECHHGHFETNMSVSFPDTTHPRIVEGVRQALSRGLDDRPDGLDYHYDKLPEPAFVQNGDKWNRYIYQLSQKELYGSVDFYTLQAIVLDCFVNELSGTVVSSTSALSERHKEVYTYVLSLPHSEEALFDYSGSYTPPLDEQ